MPRQEQLMSVTNIDVYWYLANKAYGTPEPSHDNLLEKCRSTTIKYHKKAISLYMPQRNMVWDEVQKEGNPSNSQAINNPIKQIERHEVRGMGVASAACHLIKWDEYFMLLLAVHLVFFPAEEINLHDTCGHDASVAFYWLNRQYYVSGYNDHSEKLPPPVLPLTENVQDKKYKIRVRHANANFLCIDGSTSMPCSKSCCLP